MVTDDVHLIASEVPLVLADFLQSLSALFLGSGLAYGWPDGSQLGRSRPDKKVACAQLCDTITTPQSIPKQGRCVSKQKDANTLEIMCMHNM